MVIAHTQGKLLLGVKGELLWMLTSYNCTYTVFAWCVYVSTDSSVEGLNGAVGHAGCSQPAILTALSGQSAVGDGPQGQA